MPSDEQGDLIPAAVMICQNCGRSIRECWEEYVHEDDDNRCCHPEAWQRYLDAGEVTDEGLMRAEPVWIMLPMSTIMERTDGRLP